MGFLIFYGENTAFMKGGERYFIFLNHSCLSGRRIYDLAVAGTETI